MPASRSVTPVVIIRKRSGLATLAVRDIWDYRHLLWTLGMRDVMLRYKQTFLGVAWVLVQPLLAAGVLTAVFGYVAALPGPAGVPYFAFVYIGQIGWQLFSLTLVRASGSMVGNMVLVTRIYVPRPLLPLSTVPAVLLDVGISFVIAIPILVLYASGWPNAAAALGAGACILLLGTGIGLAFATFSVRFRDILFMLPFLVQIGMYACPVAYPLGVVRENLVRRGDVYFTIFMLNPLASLVETFRWALLGHGLFLPFWFAYGAAVSVVTFLIGFAIFRTAEGKFADVI